MPKALGHGLLSLLKSGIFFLPRREIRIQFTECLDFPRGAERAEVNRFLLQYYCAVPEQNRYVPYSPWERGGKRVVPETDEPAERGQ